MDVNETLMTGGQDTNDSAGQQGSADAVLIDTPQETSAEQTPAPEGQQGESKADEVKPEGAPEAYEDFTLPEGVELEAAALDEIKAVAKELNLPQDKAQKLVDLRAKDEQARSERFVKAREDWATQTKSDPEIGGDKWNESQAAVHRAMKLFGSEDLNVLLRSSGLGNHPIVVKTFVRIGKAVSEDGKVVTGAQSATPSDPAKTMYPGMK